MAVYVDDAKARYRGMILCHMIADTPGELFAMADRLGLRRAWLHRDHFDICRKNRARAVRLGAIEITRREAARIRNGAKAAMNYPETPKHGHTPIRMRAVSDGFDGIQQLGDFCINEDGTRIQMAIPSLRPFLKKEKGWIYIDLPIGREKPAHSPSWKWDGNREKPTLEPSVWAHGHWHGWVRNGEMVEA